jgi:beta-galactosidase
MFFSLWMSHTMRMRSTRLVLFVLTLTLSAFTYCLAQAPYGNAGRHIVSLNDGWWYLENPQPDVHKLSQATEQWQPLVLPHTWNRFDVVDQEPGYRRSASWYRRSLVVSAAPDDARYILDFEGVNLKSEVYINGVLAGKHVGGYVGFTVDITPFMNRGKENEILVRADNSYDPDLIPSQKSDFCIYGGITRNVWLKVVPSRYVERVLVKTPVVTRKKGSTVIDIILRNETAESTPTELEAVIRGPSGREVARKSVSVKVVPGTNSLTLKMPEVAGPILWSPSDPALYTAVVTFKCADGQADAVSERFGYRWFEFKDHGPFFLNGERLLLRGTHRHEDLAGYGNAIPDSLQRRDMEMIKELGANFVRLAHYPQAREVYRACDELGIIVWDELPWCRGGIGGEEWKSNTRRLLKEQIIQNFNYPSIIIHSLGNEMYWLPDFPGGGVVDSLRTMIRVLDEEAHTLDPYRLTATRKFTEGADLVDLVSPSMWPGWYSGVYKSFEAAITDARKNFRKFFHAEYGGDSHIGRHNETPVTGEGMTIAGGWEENIAPQKVKNIALLSDWSESYIVNLFDWYLHISEQTEWFTGNAQWAFKDFPTPLRPENPIPYINQKGLVDRSGKPKDAYYVFKSYWTTSPAFCYIESHTWSERSGPPGVKRSVKVFSNCDEVELLLNGESLGRHARSIKEFPACGLNWDVSFAPGSNSLRAVGYNQGSKASVDTLTILYTNKKNGEADHIELSSRKTLQGTVLVTAVVVDQAGQRCLDYNKRIYFASDGPGKLLVNYGTPLRSSVIELANGGAQIEFQPVPGERAIIEARNQDFKGAYLIVSE